MVKADSRVLKKSQFSGKIFHITKEQKNPTPLGASFLNPNGSQRENLLSPQVKKKYSMLNFKPGQNNVSNMELDRNVRETEPFQLSNWPGTTCLVYIPPTLSYT